MRLAAILLLLLVTIAHTHRVDAQQLYSCVVIDPTPAAVAPASATYVVHSDFTIDLGAASLFTIDYYFNVNATHVRVEVLEVLVTRPYYTPLLNIFGAVSESFDASNNQQQTFYVSTPYNSQYSLRIQTQFAQFKLRLSACTLILPTATPTPTLTPTPTPFPSPLPAWLVPYCATVVPVVPSPTPTTVVSPRSDTGDGSSGVTPTPTPRRFEPDLELTTLAIVTLPTPDAKLCSGYSELSNVIDSYLEYTEIVANSVASVESRVTFVSRSCFVVIPTLSIPDVPLLNIAAMQVFPGLEVCVLQYEWVLKYRNINISQIIISMITFILLWRVFMLFRSG